MHQYISWARIHFVVRFVHCILDLTGTWRYFGPINSGSDSKPPAPLSKCGTKTVRGITSLLPSLAEVNGPSECTVQQIKKSDPI
ncbi:hypothetical protein OIDMADRAFT_20163 [Oidiodendron maius Zn]|uniref:Uncharacterized protein n=1 Tax=Oidiodendron maius (strain Zn) TaxID=913774 RepID=A0A0C3GNN9_OIDMZ|nr:hypothetical protein OIDMADRAFT_20163 [Oidiodendron maius Zn]